ncbi:hypothetical protein KCP75_08765 [Salmonella enterica subsp. enterica]|nr:hypothetical protein KCP75_08765 [Salmonella enterica subsp. enterica]
MIYLMTASIVHSGEILNTERLPMKAKTASVGAGNELPCDSWVDGTLSGGIPDRREFAKFLPAWLAPVQVVVMNIADSRSEYVEQLTQKHKIRRHSCNKTGEMRRLALRPRSTLYVLSLIYWSVW